SRNRMGSRSPRLASSMIVLATIVTTGSLRSTRRNWRTASSSAAASTATVSGPKISCSRSAGFEKGISRYALKHAPAAHGKKTERHFKPAFAAILSAEHLATTALSSRARFCAIIFCRFHQDGVEFGKYGRQLGLIGEAVQPPNMVRAVR